MKHDAVQCSIILCLRKGSSASFSRMVETLKEPNNTGPHSMRGMRAAGGGGGGGGALAFLFLLLLFMLLLLLLVGASMFDISFKMDV